MIAQRTRDIGDGYVGSDLLTMMLHIDRRCRRSVLHRRGSARRGHIGPAGTRRRRYADLAWHLLATNPQWRVWLTEEVDALEPNSLDGRSIYASYRAPMPWSRSRCACTRRRGSSGVGSDTDRKDLVGWGPAARERGCWPAIYHASRSRSWSDAHAFRPDRWLTGEGTFDERAPRFHVAWFLFGPGPSVYR